MFYIAKYFLGYTICLTQHYVLKNHFINVNKDHYYHHGDFSAVVDFFRSVTYWASVMLSMEMQSCSENALAQKRISNNENKHSGF